MGHHVLPRAWIAGECCDVDALNENFASMHNTLSSLNEHNFDASCLTGLEATWAQDMALRVNATRTSIDPYGGSTVAISHTGQWATLSGLTIDVTTRGGKCLLVTSFQIATISNLSAGREVGLNFAFEIDGSVDYGSLLGSADLTNDFIKQGQLATAAYAYTGIDWDAAPAVRGGYIPVVIERVVYLSPGIHTINVVARNLKTSVDAFQNISQAMLVALEMWA